MGFLTERAKKRAYKRLRPVPNEPVVAFDLCRMANSRERVDVVATDRALYMYSHRAPYGDIASVSFADLDSVGVMRRGMLRISRSAGQELYFKAIGKPSDLWAYVAEQIEFQVSTAAEFAPVAAGGFQGR